MTSPSRTLTVCRPDHPEIPDLAFATPLPVTSPSECHWYHTFEWPDGTITRGRWDYRGKADSYLGHQDFQGRTVLEIGPASGYLTKEMEARGAAVTCIELSDDEPWEAVPRKDVDSRHSFMAQRVRGLPMLRRSWWYSQQRFDGTARIAYCGAAALSKLSGCGRFDIALMGCILQHFRHPADVLYATAELADTIIVTEPIVPRIEAHGGVEFYPGPGNASVDSWWLLSSSTVSRILATAGLHRTSHTANTFRRWDLVGDSQDSDGYHDYQFYTSVFRRSGA